MPRRTPSGVEEHRLVGALQADVEAVEAGLGRIGLGHQRVAAVGRHQRQDRVGGVGRIAGEVDAREQPLQQAAREDADIDVRRLQRAAGTRHLARLDGGEGEAAVLVGRAAAEAAKRVGGERPAVGGMRVAALAVGLPDLDQRVGHDVAVAVEHAALDADVGAGHAGVGDHWA